ncbi:MAG: hypothetical protein ACLQVI_20805 [Polyangiaceae bacterium]
MIAPDVLSAALLAYLGGEPGSPGVMPVSCMERLRAAFPDDPAIKDAVDAVLKELGEDSESYNHSDLRVVGELATARMKRLHPEFSDVLVAKLGNMYSYWSK